MRSLSGISLLAVAAVLLAASPACAQVMAAEPGPVASDPEIVVTADRSIVAALGGISPEREYSDEDVGSYGVSTVGEFVDEVRAENGDDEAVFLVNGEPVSGVDDIADFPAEAIERLEVLPRGSGQRIGREPDRRVYNVVLKDQLRSATLTASREEATEGAWGQSNGEAILSRIAGRKRLNLTLRVRDSDMLTEADRGIIQPDPATATRPADYYESVDGGAFRTLRPDSRNYEASLVGGGPLAPWLTSSFSFLGRISRDRTLAGLPYELFTLPGGSPFSPTGTDQMLVLFGPDALENRAERHSLNGNATFNATRGSWIASLTAQFALSDRDFGTERLDRTLFQEPISVPAGRNPFSDPLDEFFVTDLGTAEANDRSWLVKLNVSGALFDLPAGPLRARAAVQRDGNRARTTNITGTGTIERTYHRSATRLDAGLDIPLASKRAGFIGALGELTVSLDRSYDLVDNLRDLEISSITGLWQPSPRLSISGTVGKVEELPSLELLADPVIVYDNVRTFDFLTGETVDVSVITGGNPALRPLSRITRRLSVSGAAWPRYNLQLSLDYEANKLRDFVGAVPAASSAVFLAFPERFQRDASGRLVTIDSRPTNFDRQFREEVRYGVSFSVPLGGKQAASDGSAAAETFRPVPPGAQTRLQVNASHSIALKNEVVYGPGLPVVDLLEGGALGFGSGQPRHIVNASVALSNARYGLRASALYRSSSSLVAGTTALPDTLRFAPIFTASLRAYAELGPLIPDAAWLEGTRLSVAVDNIANARQRVTADSGRLPLRYQPAYRDPVGRTIEIELRRTF